MNSLHHFCFDSQFMFLKDQEHLYHMFMAQLRGNKSIEFDQETSSFYRSEEWDRQHFGWSTGRILWMENNKFEVQDYNKILQLSAKFKCCYLRVNSQHPFNSIALQEGLNPMGSKCTQHLTLKDRSFTFDKEIEFRQLVTKNILDEEHGRSILNLASESFSNNRFRADVHFPKTKVDELYQLWIMNEVNSGSSELYYVLDNDQLAAFILYRPNISPLEKIKVGFVSLIAASKMVTKKGYAGQLMDYVFSKHSDETDYVISNTEKQNQHAIQFFQKHGFTLTAELNEYHLWN